MFCRCAYQDSGPCYLRLSRDVYPDLYASDTQFRVGGGNVVREGADATVFACGILVHKALEAAEILAQEGIQIQVVDLYSIKPIDEELIRRCAVKTGAVVTAEEHGITGGLGSAVAEVLAREGAAVPVEMVGVKDTFTESGPYAKLLEKYKLDAKAVADAVRTVRSRRYKA